MLVCNYFVSVVAAIGCCCKLVVIKNSSVVLSQTLVCLFTQNFRTVQHVLSAERVQNVESGSLSPRSCTHILGPSS